jgi:hypothetical protein
MTQQAAICFMALMGLLAGIGSRAVAAPITWAFEGTVRYANMGDASALAGSLGVIVGASASGHLTYESTTPEADPGQGTYPSAVTGFEVSIGSYTTGALDGGVLDAFYVRLRDGNPYDADIVDGFHPGDALFPGYPGSAIIELSLIADTPGVISGSALPAAPPPLSALRPFSIDDWTTIGYGTGLYLFRDAGPDLGGVLVEFTRLEVVPEPGAPPLVVLAVIGLALRRRSAL